MLDSFTLLEQLRMESPQHFATLARVPATFQNTAYSQRYVNLDRDVNTMIILLQLPRGGKVAPQPDLRYQRPHITLDSSGRVSTLSVYISIPIVQSYNRKCLYWYKCVA